MSQQNDIEITKQKLSLAKELLKKYNMNSPHHETESKQPGTPTPQDIDKTYEQQLISQIAKKKSLLNTAKRQTKQNSKITKTTKGLIVGTIKTNDKLPFKPERDDTIPISLALSVLQKQIDQGRSTLERLDDLESSLQLEVSQQKKINDELKLVNDLLIEQPTTTTEEHVISEDVINEKIIQEKQRYRTLRKHLRDLINKYENGTTTTTIA